MRRSRGSVPPVSIAVDQFVHLAVTFLIFQHGLFETSGELQQERLKCVVACDLAELLVGEPGLLELIKDKLIAVIEVEPESLVDLIDDC
ncbi:hypothetical protein [Mycobacterium sp.]|uniref:hypothetical protein n=1 Tax=Mycobacterium sp. TaxID=1785 RepID=UPI002C4B9EC2|nr:hypothetical protein [Mycobacterium sp.]HTY31275.1 hypothetical protein [Mycobacterium sp.]